MHRRPGILAFAAVLGGCAASQPFAAPTPVREAATAVEPPAVEAAEPETCEIVRDGNTIARTQSEVEKLIERLQTEPTYAWARYEHAPCYRVVLAFTDGRPPKWLLAEASAELRSYLRFDKAREPLSHAQFEQARQEIFAVLPPTGVKALVGVSPDMQRVTIGVRTEADAELVRSVIPIRHRAMTRVVAGGYAEPIPERATER